jgi:hypothetical protein
MGYACLRPNNIPEDGTAAALCTDVARCGLAQALAPDRFTCFPGNP